jgi:FKBP-type peptidyl-prolyl cis-trans isomerase SlpA
MYEIQPGSQVRMHLKITLPNGTVAEDTFSEEPLEFTMNDGTLIPSLELALYGLREGQIQTLELQPEQAFGLSDPNNVHQLPRSQFPDDMQLEPGQIIGFESEQGEELPGVIQSVDNDTVTVDFNHPLAGKTIILHTEVLSIKPPADEQE